MSQETDNILRKSLDEVDGIRKRQTIAFGILFCMTSGLLAWLVFLFANPVTDVRKLVLLAAAALFLGMVYVAAALAMVQSKMTLKVLKAIELLSKQ